MKTPKNFADAMVRCAKVLGVEAKDLEYTDFNDWIVSELKEIDKSKDYNSIIHNLKRIGGFKKVKEAEFGVEVNPDALLVKEKVKKATAVAKSEAKEQHFVKSFEAICDKYFTNRVVIPKFNFKKHKDYDRNLHLLLSDMHFGALLRPEEGLTKYGRLEASRRLAKVVGETIDYKIQYRDKTKLIVNINGDVIQGKLHDLMDGEEIGYQVGIAIHLLEQALAHFAANFPEVEVNCATGNHDRNKERHNERAIAGKWDGHAVNIFYALKKAMSRYSNIKINIPLTPWVAYQSFGVNYFGTHGDTHIKPGNPGSAVNVKGLENQINALNASLKDTDEYKVVFLGHVHVGMMLRLNNGVTLITNPPLIPVDAFAKSIGIWESPTGQWLWESIPGYPVGDSRYLVVDTSTDADHSLDTLIKPFDGFDK